MSQEKPMPDGPEERQAELDEQFELEREYIDIDELRDYEDIL